MNAVIRTIVFALVALTVVFYGGAYLLPSEASVERSVEIAAPPEKVFAIAGDLRRVPDWSPWLAIDPATRFSFEGPGQGGVGQVMRWASNNPLVGSGTQKVTGYVQNERLETESDHGEFGTTRAVMSLAPGGAGTILSWRVQSPLPGVVDRWAGLMIDAFLGAECEKGLANIKALAESR